MKHRLVKIMLVIIVVVAAELALPAVIPAQAGIQDRDPRFRGDDKGRSGDDNRGGDDKGGKASFAATATSKIKIVTKDADLGEVKKNEIYDFKIEVRNVGKDDLTITNVSSSCGCLAVVAAASYAANGASAAQGAATTPVVLKPNHSINVLAKLDTNKVSGEFERMIHVYSDDTDNPDVTWTVRGSVAAKLALPEDREGRASSAATDVRNAKIIMIFHSSGCNECREIMEEFLPEIKKKYQDKIMIVDYNIDNMESYAFMLSLQDKYDEKTTGGFYNPKPPVLFIENRLLYGVKDIKKDLEGIIEGKNG